MPEHKQVETDKAPKAVGPYSQAVIAGDFIFCSGQVAFDPATGQLVEGGIVEQTKRVLENLKAVLLAGGSDLHQVVKCEVFLKNMEDFKTMNEIYAEYFCYEPKPARVTVEVARLPKDALIEISCTAYRNN